MYSTVYCGGDKLTVAISRNKDGDVKYLSNIIAKSTVLNYSPAQGEALCAMLNAFGSEDVGLLFPEERWIYWPNSKLDSKKTVSMFPPGRHNVGYPAGLVAMNMAAGMVKAAPPGNHAVDKPLYLHLREASTPSIRLEPKDNGLYEPYKFNG